MSATTAVIDKSTWGPGPWQDEPDRVDFVHQGLACLLLRDPRGGNWCAYVGVPREHRLHGKDWIDQGPLFEGLDAEVNYTAVCGDPICHTPEPGMPDDVWWIGRDFGHTWDFCPARVAREIEKMGPRPACMDRLEVYRDLADVRRVTEQLAGKLAAMLP